MTFMKQVIRSTRKNAAHDKAALSYKSKHSFTAFKQCLPVNNILVAPSLAIAEMASKKIINLFKFKRILSLFFIVLISSCADSADTLSKDSSIKASATILNQKELKQFANELSVQYNIVENQPEGKCNKKYAEGNCFLVEITLTYPETIYADNWAIYFSHIAPARSSSSHGLTLKHVNGDLHRITPSKQFSSLSPEPVSVSFLADFWHLSNSDVMPNYFVVVNDLKPEIIANTNEANKEFLVKQGEWFFGGVPDKPEYLLRGDKDKTRISSASFLYHQYNSQYEQQAKQQSSWKQRIIPKPYQSNFSATESLSLTQGIYLQQNDFDPRLNQADDENAVAISPNVKVKVKIAHAINRLAQIGVKQSEQGVPVTIRRSSEKSAHPESYQLSIDKNNIDILAPNASGAFYALMSLASLLDPETKTVATGSVQDKPRFDFRGMHLDIARNFHQVTLINKLLDQMSAYKLNKLHLHLADDEGWRVAIRGLPELTDIGGFRCFDLTETRCLLPQLGSGPFRNTSVNGFLNEAEYKAILIAAAERNIEVIPSFDMPGHSRAAVKAMEARFQNYKAKGELSKATEFLLTDRQDTTEYESVQYYHDNTINVCQPSTYRFVFKVIDEVKRMHQEAGVPLNRYHIGADETAGAWKQSPVCQRLIAETSSLNSVDDLTGYFIEKVAKYLSQKQIIAAGWSDGMKLVDDSNMPKPVQVNEWSTLFWGGHRSAHQLVNDDWQVVISSPDVLYFDFLYEVDAKEPGYYWASRRSNSQKVFQFMPDNLPAHAEIWQDRSGYAYQADDRPSSSNPVNQPIVKGKRVYGIQGQFWSESIRADAQVEYMIFPRLLALAERAWHKADWELLYHHQGRLYSQNSEYFTGSHQRARELDWLVFRDAVGYKELLKLDAANIAYRLPGVGAIRHNHQLLVNSEFPGVTVEVKPDENAPWQAYSPDVTVTDTALIRARSADGQRTGRAIPVETR
ncbi:hexosaminidase [Pleionea mediterranea]|uniref:beta-N-acetylhexosaminidase n=2 Tax=Pleionea mediterranea TaxID=523701 RepID=A0A316FI26_9GAMM|nr:hexosaminidase [Pleionea mediterranea]